MTFNENKYLKCIKHLVAIKALIVLSYIIILACIGAGIGYPIMQYVYDEWYIIAISVGIGAILGLIIGLLSTWRIEMKIQEAYWKIAVLHELRKQTSNSNKNTPVAKTVVAIENKQSPTDTVSSSSSEKQDETN